MKRLGAIIACLGLFLAFAQVQTAAAQTSEGLFNSVSYKAVAKGASIAVQPLDNSDNNLILQQEFEKQLKRAGYKVTDTARLILSFEVRNEIGAWSTTGRRHILELSARGGKEGGEDAKARLNLFDSNKGGMFNKGSGGTRIVTPSQYRIDATIDDKTNGKRLWQAWSSADLSTYDTLELANTMVPVMVRNLGKTVKQQPFKLP